MTAFFFFLPSCYTVPVFFLKTIHRLNQSCVCVCVCAVISSSANSLCFYHNSWVPLHVCPVVAAAVCGEGEDPRLRRSRHRFGSSRCHSPLCDALKCISKALAPEKLLLHCGNGQMLGVWWGMMASFSSTTVSGSLCRPLQ